MLAGSCFALQMSTSVTATEVAVTESAMLCFSVCANLTPHLFYIQYLFFKNFEYIKGAG